MSGWGGHDGLGDGGMGRKGRRREMSGRGQGVGESVQAGPKPGPAVAFYPLFRDCGSGDWTGLHVGPEESTIVDTKGDSDVNVRGVERVDYQENEYISPPPFRQGRHPLKPLGLNLFHSTPKMPTAAGNV